jgi:hypothetical protein
MARPVRATFFRRNWGARRWMTKSGYLIEKHTKTTAWRTNRRAAIASDAIREMGVFYKTSVTLQAQSVNESCYF